MKCNKMYSKMIDLGICKIRHEWILEWIFQEYKSSVSYPACLLRHPVCIVNKYRW